MKNRPTKNYVLNVKRKTLHKINGCYYAKTVFDFEEFNTIEELENSGRQFTKCTKCFKGRKA